MFDDAQCFALPGADQGRIGARDGCHGSVQTVVLLLLPLVGTESGRLVEHHCAIAAVVVSVARLHHRLGCPPRAAIRRRRRLRLLPQDRRNVTGRRA